MKILKWHLSPETAYVVDDYPYGFRLRCKMRYWLDYKAGYGVRLMMQSTNPKKGGIWNKPKGSTYCKFGGCMYLDDKGHVHWNGLTEYSSGAEAAAFLAEYGEGVPPAAMPQLKGWVAAKVAYEGARGPNDPLAVGLAEANRAFATAAIQHMKEEGK